ncbi:hypothetical protein CRUP_015649, partial [Coryphaenoides rupestris]
NDNTALRRMNLRSFLMAPLQRVTKYPLLLSRISKASAEGHPDHACLWEAKLREKLNVGKHLGDGHDVLYVPL